MSFPYKFNYDDMQSVELFLKIHLIQDCYG